jgi:hypothetical protein
MDYTFNNNILDYIYMSEDEWVSSVNKRIELIQFYKLNFNDTNAFKKQINLQFTIEAMLRDFYNSIFYNLNYYFCDNEINEMFLLLEQK